MLAGIGTMVVKMVTSASVSTVVGNVIKHTTPNNLSLAKKGLVIVGELVLSSMASAAAADYVVKSIDQTFNKTK